MPLYIPETFYPQTTTTIETKQLRDSGHKSMANLGCPALVTCSKYPLIVSTGQTLELQGIQKRHAILKTAEPEKKKLTTHGRSKVLSKGTSLSISR